MRNIAIIGAGQAGLQLGIGLLKAGYKVLLYSHYTAKEVLNGSILSSPSMFHSALQCEREFGLNYWDTVCLKNKTITFTLSNKTEIAVYWRGKTSYPYQAIDQRLKFSRWIEEFVRLGGQLVVQTIRIKDLSRIAQQQDLTVITSGKGEISQLFLKDVTRSAFDKVQRILCCLYVKDVLSVAGSQGVRANIIPGIGEYFITPGLTLTGPCEMMLFEGLPGGPFDCWQGITSSTQRLEKALELLKKFIPWEAEHCQKISLTDNQATLQGSYIPVVRKPVFNLPCGKLILGIGDSVVLNDPIGGQGANSACQAAAFYLEKIKEHENKLFTAAWMYEIFELYWKQFAQWSTQWTNLLLKPSKSLIALLHTASTQANVANQLADAFDDPSKLLPLIIPD
jgi:flavin-dependent dehydrogenase